MPNRDRLPWEPDSDAFDGLVLPSGVFVTFEPSPACDCADCTEAREEGYFDPEAAA